MEDTHMQKLDPIKDTTKLSALDLANIREVESRNIERATKVLRMRKANLLTGTMLIAGVLGIYSYTMFTVKQESFLDDFDEPEKI